METPEDQKKGAVGSTKKLSEKQKALIRKTFKNSGFDVKFTEKEVIVFKENDGKKKEYKFNIKAFQTKRS